jgi:hypothetical protein
LLPEREFRDFAPPPKTLPRTGHYNEWIQAAKGGKPATCNFDLGSRMTEVPLLGTLAARTARYLEWDTSVMEYPRTSIVDRKRRLLGLDSRAELRTWPQIEACVSQRSRCRYRTACPNDELLSVANIS